jgi:putative membrane protein
LSLLFLGMVISYFSVSLVLDYLIKHYELYVWSVFFGMIIGSIYQINKDFNGWGFKTLTSLVIGALLGLGITLLSPAKENDNLWFVFFCGIISVCGMPLPGLSGSFILILLGNYVLLLVDSVNALFNTVYEILGGNFEFINNPARIKLLKVLAVFSLGSLTGLVTISHILSYILKHYKNITLAAILGFIVGSLGVVWPWKKTIYKITEEGEYIYDSAGAKVIQNYTRYIPELNLETLYAILFIGLGITLVLALEIYGRKTRKTHA